MQRSRIDFENLLYIVREQNLTNFTLLIDEYGKEYVIESRTTDETDIDTTINLISRIVLMYPISTNFKIVLKPTKTANASSIRTIFFSRTSQNEPNQKPQNQGLGGFEGLGAIERMIETQNSINKKEWEVERKAQLEEFNLLLEKKDLKKQKEDFKEEKRIFENDKKNAVAKKLGEGLGAFLLNYAKGTPQLGAIISQLEGSSTGLGSVEEEEEEPYEPKKSILDDLEDGSLSLEDLQNIINSKTCQAYANQNQEETDDDDE